MIYFIFALLVLLAAGYFMYQTLLIISGYGAKILCSGVFVCNRKPEEILQNDLNFFPVNVGSFSIDNTNLSATGTVWGLAKKKAVFREGLGATLLNGISEAECKNQRFDFPSPSTNKQDFEDWPMGDRINSSLHDNIKKNKLDLAVAMAFEGSPAQSGTRAVIVLYEGEMVAERYAPGILPSTKLAGWSLAKSITNALIGILVKENKIDINQPAPVEQWKYDARKNITTKNLLHMSSGLKWWEFYAAPSDATYMLYQKRNMATYAISKPLKHAIGKFFNYSSGTTNILSYIIKKCVEPRQYIRFPYEQLFYKIGMNNTILELAADGTFASSSYCYGTARDWARFGLLYLNDGVMNGERILPEGWVDFTTTPNGARSAPNEGTYGAHFWLNTSKDDDPATKKYPIVPDDCYRCQGYEGQYIWIIPSRKLVVVRLALEKDVCLDPNIFLPAIIDALPQK